MILDQYLAQYTLDDIIAIEESDEQFLVLKSAWELVKNAKKSGISAEVRASVFLIAMIQNALISYQIAGSGELWWGEFCEKLVKDFDVLCLLFLERKTNSDRWYNVMQTSRWNKRLYNLKLKRIVKFQSWLDKLYVKNDQEIFLELKNYYQHMEVLWKEVSQVMKSSPSAKTMTFVVKMFGYAARSVFGYFVAYPLEIPIPVDSRIRQIYHLSVGKLDVKDCHIQDYFHQLSLAKGIPPLHVDALFWVKFWKKM